MRHGRDDHTHDDTEDKGLAEHAKLLLQTLGIDIEFVETRNAVQEPPQADGKRRETLAERLWHGDARKIVILLEPVGRQVGHDKGEDVTHDSCEITPEKALVEDKIDHGTDEGKMPVVPQVDVDSARSLRDDHEEVDAKTDGDDEGTHSGVVSHRSGSGPAHVEDAEIEREDVLNGL